MLACVGVGCGDDDVGPGSPEDALRVDASAATPDAGALGHDDAGDAAVDAAAPLRALNDEALRALLAPFAPSTLPAPPADRSNAHADDARAAALGQKLFFDTGYSGALLDGDNDGSEHSLGMRGQTGRVSCAGCHVPKAGFSDDRTLGGAISLGAGWGNRRTPSLLDIGQASLLMWDGRRDSFFSQIFGPLEAPFEMNSSRLYMAKHIYATYRAEYEAIFGAMPDLSDTSTYPDLTAAETGCQVLDNHVSPPTCAGTKHGMPGDGAEYDGMTAAAQDAVTRIVVNAGKALGAYQRTLSCGTSRVDAWVHGDASALSETEKHGAELFAGKARCDSCHAGPFMSDQKFHNVGLRGDTVAVAFSTQNDQGAAVGLAAALNDPLNVRSKYSDADDGRLPQAVDASTTLGAFRTPTLRCADMRPRFMHNGQLISLEEVVAFFSRGGDPGGYPGQSELQSLDLSELERQDLVAFLRALRGPGPSAALLQRP
jgi:cytochrome c peroxidase